MEKNRVVRFSLIAILAIIIVYLGFLRDSLFVNLNAQIYHFEAQTGEFVGGGFYQSFFEDSTLEYLRQLKWIFTLAFTLLFYGATILGMRLIYSTNQYFRLITLIFVGIFSVSAVLYLAGWATGYFATGYRFARLFMGAIQSPFILLLLIPGVQIVKKNPT